MSKKTKIICTIGPASESKEVLTKLVEAGMNIARLNFSHGDYEEHAERVKRIREVSKETGKPIGILLDTKGPEIRLVRWHLRQIQSTFHLQMHHRQWDHEYTTRFNILNHLVSVYYI